MTAPTTAPGVRQSECRVCPPYVVRCSHLDGDERVVWRIDAVEPEPECGHDTPKHNYLVVFGKPKRTESCACCIAMGVKTSRYRYTDTRAAADAAFARFEAQLLGREEAS